MPLKGEDKTKVGFYMPNRILDAHREFVMGQPSENLNGANIVWMALPAAPREEVLRLMVTPMPVPELLLRVRRIVRNAMGDELLAMWARTRSKSERAKIIREMRDKER